MATCFIIINATLAHNHIAAKKIHSQVTEMMSYLSLPQPYIIKLKEITEELTEISLRY